MFHRLRPVADKILAPFVVAFMKVDPAVITVFSLVFAGLAFISLLQGGNFLLLGFLFILLNGAFDGIDGRLARKKKVDSVRGAFLDHVIDRYSDILILLGVAFGPYCDVTVGLLAIVFVMLVSYLGTSAVAAGVGRDYGGMLGRADRYVAILIVVLVQFLMNTFGAGMIFGRFWFEWLMIYFLIGANIGSVQRALGIWKKLPSQVNQK